MESGILGRREQTRGLENSSLSVWAPCTRWSLRLPHLPQGQQLKLVSNSLGQFAGTFLAARAVFVGHLEARLVAFCQDGAGPSSSFAPCSGSLAVCLWRLLFTLLFLLHI